MPLHPIGIGAGRRLSSVDLFNVSNSNLRQALTRNTVIGGTKPLYRGELGLSEPLKLEIAVINAAVMIKLNSMSAPGFCP